MSVATHEAPITNLEDSIMDTAAMYGVTLDADRQLNLMAAGGYAQRVAGYSEITENTTVFGDNTGVEVKFPHYSEQYGTVAARLDFTPSLPEDGEDILVGDSSARPDRATEYTLMGLRGMQNFALLVEAGVIEKPEVLFGNTNPEMAIVAERLGLMSGIARQNEGPASQAHKEMRETKGKLEIHATYDEVRDRLFSDESRRLERILVRRLAAQRAGVAALHAS